MPQLFGSLAVFTHVADAPVPHWVSAPAQPQAPPPVIRLHVS
jgi:hypothetical protein